MTWRRSVVTARSSWGYAGSTTSTTLCHTALEK